MPNEKDEGERKTFGEDAIGDRTRTYLINVEVMAMSIVSESVLLESKSARDNQMLQIPHERACDLLNKLKALYFAIWSGIGASTTAQMARFYEVDIDAIESVLRRHRDELELDGVQTLKGSPVKAFKDVSAS